MRNDNTMLHMKLNSAVSVFAVAAAFSVLLPPSNAYGGICFLPDCMDEDVVQGDFNMNINEDTEYCEKEGYTYYASGKCPQYQDVIAVCSRDDHYLKCDAETWCKNNGYNTQTCSLPSYLNEKCPNDYPLYKECKEDPGRACREAGYVNSCSPGRLYANSNRCPWDSSYGKCCTAAPSSGCPSNHEVGCSGSASGTDACGYTCYKCCDDTCPAGTSKNYSGTYTSTTECGSSCYRCKDCTSGSTSYTGKYVGSSECGSCYACNDTCKTGSASVDCSPTQNRTKVSTTECGTACYSCEDNPDCSVEDKSCLYGCSSYNSCGKCTACGSNPDCDATDLSCPDFGCATTNSCGKCIACNGDPCDSVTAVTPPANASCSSYYSTCSSKCSAWTCNSGYTKSGNSCVEQCTDTCSSKGYKTSQPSGQTCSTTTVCGQTCYYDCKSSCTDTCSSKGYKTSQPSGYTCSTTSVCGQTCYKDCVCATTCEDKVTSKPANSSYTTESCTACGSTKTINTGWTCNDGYEKSGNSCVEQCTDTCSSKGYQTSQPSGQTCSTTTVCGKTCYYDCKTAEDARCEAARNGDSQYMPHYGYYMSCQYSGGSFIQGQEGIRLCCNLWSGHSNYGTSFDSFSCGDEIYHVCRW